MIVEPDYTTDLKQHSLERAWLLPSRGRKP